VSVENRVRDAIRAYTETIEPSPNGWERIEGRLARPSRRRAWQGVVAAAAIVIAVALVVLLFARGDHGGRVATQASGSRLPARVAAVKADGRLLLQSSRDGHELRTLAQGAMTDEPGLTVDARGVTAYFTRPMANPPCAGLGASGDVPELVRVALAGGPVEALTPPGVFPVTGFHPIVSPSGQSIAFMGAPCGGGLLASFNLSTPNTPAGPVWGGAAPRTIITPLAWSSDSQQILFEAVLRGETEPRLLVTDAMNRGQQATGLWGPGGFTAATYRQDVLVIAQQDKRRFRVLEVNAGQVRQLFRGKGTSPTSMEFDASGHNVLYVADERLFRWSDGDARPKKLADGVVSAAWVTDRPTTVDSMSLRDVTKLAPSPARRKLESDGLTVAVEYRTDRVSPGRILEQRPAPGTRVRRGDQVALVVDAFLPCGGSFRPTALPKDFDPQSRPGPAPEAAAAGVPGPASVLHYTDGHGRSIEIRRPATSGEEPAAEGAQPADADVLGQSVTMRPLAPGRDEPLIARFFFPVDQLSDPCGSYSINGYGVTKREMRTFAESLVPVP
jgi:PASTA domain